MTPDTGLGTRLQQLYEPLSEERLEIRLLHLEGSGEYNSEIRCRLRRVSLLDTAKLLHLRTGSTSTSFEALSYTWGDPSDRRDIIVNDRIFYVTANLEAFLRQRREADTQVVLWVDAICINQDDAQEKSTQIPKMNMIYSAAARLTVWLGPASHDSSVALKYLLDLGAGSPYDKMPALDHDVVKSLVSLLSRPWWRRVWIVQELCSGGLAYKLQHVRIRCGKDSVMWMNAVVAAVRIRAYSSDLRQLFPNLDTILELDSLRQSASRFLACPDDRICSFDLVSRYRHFLATNPRDKLYALCNIFAGTVSKPMPTRYDRGVEQIYIDFAMEKVSADNDLEILRHCGASTLNLPSWVPDWTKHLGWKPFPLRMVPRYLEVPWWAEPIDIEPHAAIANNGTLGRRKVEYNVKPYPRDPDEAARRREMDLGRLEFTVRGFRIINDLTDGASGFAVFNGAPADFRLKLPADLNLDSAILSSMDTRHGGSGSQYFATNHLDALRQGELITEREVKSWLVQELKADLDSGTYQTSATTQVDVVIEKDQKTLKAKGILWGTVDVCHSSFIDDLETDWKNATRFMVSVGSCKALALTHAAAAQHYPGREQLLKAFWSTLFAGKVAQASRKGLCYADWLPAVPQGWEATSPPFTATTTGLVELHEVQEAVSQVQYMPVGVNVDDGDEYRPLGETSVESPRLNVVTYPQGPETDTQQHKDDLEELASSWNQQPYDLYHRPFRFLHIVPDPYWETRKRHDGLALRHTREQMPAPLVSLPRMSSTNSSSEERAKSLEYIREYRSRVHEILIEKPSIVPQGTLDIGSEEYALGRRFFVTKGGYFGLGPKDTRPGDRVAVLFGSGVPFVLRKHAWATGRRGWQLVGETYVHGVMQGEVVKSWETGMVEAGMISIC